MDMYGIDSDTCYVCELRWARIQSKTLLMVGSLDVSSGIVHIHSYRFSLAQREKAREFCFIQKLHF